MKLFKFLNRNNISTAAILKNSSRLSKEAEQFAKTRAASGSTVDPSEVQRHASLSSKWWDANGELQALHTFNRLRVQFVRDGLANTAAIINAPCESLQGVKIADIGCGGGILSEALARIGADVTGIDASEELIEIATKHAKLDPSLSGKLNYVCNTIEKFAEQYQNTYDAIVASEILEHVNDKELFLKSCTDVIKPGGSLFITTFNKTLPSWFGGIIAAELIFKIVPRGVHSWEKFISPADTQRLLESCKIARRFRNFKHAYVWLNFIFTFTGGCKTKLIHGTFFNPLTYKWSWTASTMFHYGLHAVKRENRQ